MGESCAQALAKIGIHLAAWPLVAAILRNKIYSNLI